jgi:hypothetical protein
LHEKDTYYLSALKRTYSKWETNIILESSRKCTNGLLWNKTNIIRLFDHVLHYIIKSYLHVWCLKRSRNWLPFTNTSVHARFLCDPCCPPLSSFMCCVFLFCLSLFCVWCTQLCRCLWILHADDTWYTITVYMSPIEWHSKGNTKITIDIIFTAHDPSPE